MTFPILVLNKLRFKEDKSGTTFPSQEVCGTSKNDLGFSNPKVHVFSHIQPCPLACLHSTKPFCVCVCVCFTELWNIEVPLKKVRAK